MKAKLLILAGSVVIGGLSVFSPAYGETKQLWTVCHGEFESTCKKHSYNKWEECSAKNGVKGADNNVSCQNLCGKAKGPGSCVVERLPGTTAEKGNRCGYSWFTVSCF